VLLESLGGWVGGKGLTLVKSDVPRLPSFAMSWSMTEPPAEN